jgi:hypothetical protein
MDSAVLYAIGQIGICIQQLFMILFTIPIGDLPINMGELLLFGIALKISISLFFTSYTIKGTKSSKVKKQAKQQYAKDGVGFTNQDITISFDTNGSNNLDKVYADVKIAITYKDYYNYIFNNDIGIIYLVYNGIETPFSIYENGAQFLNLTQVIDPEGNYMSDITKAPNYELFNAENNET